MIDIAKIKILATHSKEQIGETEENVKITFMVPFLECFGHKALDFEYRFKDIIIKRGIHQNCVVIIETKRYERLLDGELSQLARYCHEERAMLGLIANGEEIRVYSPFWRTRTDFANTLIYRFDRSLIADENIITKLDKILSHDNLRNGQARRYVIERELELERVEENVIEVEEQSLQEELKIQNQIDELEQQIKDNGNQVNVLKHRINDIRQLNHDRVSQLWKSASLEKPTIVSQTNDRNVSAVENISIVQASNNSYYPKYKKQLENPSSMASLMLKIIRDRRNILYKELEQLIIQKGYQASGSIGACVRVLVVEGLVKDEGRGKTRKLSFIRDHS